MDGARLPSLGPRGEGWVVLQGVFFVGVWVAGIIWYFAWSAYNKAKSGMDISAVTYGELPPE
jgi:hypothetical protein